MNSPFIQMCSTEPQNILSKNEQKAKTFLQALNIPLHFISYKTEDLQIFYIKLLHSSSESSERPISDVA